MDRLSPDCILHAYEKQLFKIFRLKSSEFLKINSLQEGNFVLKFGLGLSGADTFVTRWLN